MASRVITTAYGRPALDTLRHVVVEAKSADPMAPVTLIVPNNLAGIVARRHLAGGVRAGHGPGVSGLHVTTLPRLAEQLAAATLAPRTPATRPVVAACWRQALHDDPGVFGDVAGHPATVRALAEAHRELRDLSAGQFDSIRDASTVSRAVTGLYERASRAIDDRHYDPTTLLDGATALVTSEPGRLTDRGTLVLYLPQDLSQAEARFATAVSDAAGLTVVAALTGVERADGAVRRSLERLGIPLDGAEPAPSPVDRPTATHVINASDSDDEVRCVVRDVVDTLATTPAHRVAVLYAAASPYARLLHEHLANAGLAVNGPGTRAVNERAVARTLLETLALVEGDLPRADLFRAVASAPTRDFAGTRIPVARWERISRSAGVVRGDDWAHRLTALVDTEQATIASEQGSDDPRDWAIQRSQRTIDTARDLLTFATTLRERLRQAETMTRWDELARWCRNLFTTLVGEPEELRGLPAEEQYAAATAISTLDALAGLDAVDAHAGYQALREVLELELSTALPRVGRFGEGVLVAPLSHAVGLDVDVVYVVGLAEDLCPGRLHEDALLPERVRSASDGGLASYRERLHRKQRHLLAAFACAGERSVATFPRGDLRRSSRRLPSRWLLPSLRALADDKELAASDWETADYHGRMLTSSSFAGQLLTTTRLAHEQEWRIRQARAGGRLDDEAADTVEAAVAMIRGRASSRFTRYDGNLTGVGGLPDYADGERVISPTRLEAYVACPHAFFVQYLLGVQQLEQPEDVVTISPADIGNVVHYSLDRLVREHEDKLPGYGEGWTIEQRARMAAIAEEVMAEFEDRGLTGHPRLWEREKLRLLADLARILDDDDQWRREHGARVVASEMTFGMRGLSPVAVPLPNGGAVSMRGSADKVDLDQTGTLYVTDVKTGSRRTFTGISQDDPFVGAAKLQLPVYAFAARVRYGEQTSPVQTTYWFVRRKPGDSATTDRIGFLLTPEVETTYGHILATLTEAIRSGMFPLRAPEQPDVAWVQCDYCNPDGIGHGEERERWERKRTDPLLRPYVALVEPDALVKADAVGASADQEGRR